MEHRGGKLRSSICTGGTTSWPALAARCHGCSPPAHAQPEPRGVGTSTHHGTQFTIYDLSDGTAKTNLSACQTGIVVKNGPCGLLYNIRKHVAESARERKCVRKKTHCIPVNVCSWTSALLYSLTCSDQSPDPASP